MKPAFDSAFREQFHDLVLWRRDVRRFRRDPLPRERIDTLIEIATHAPSVGLSQPWRFVHVDSPERRLAVIKSFTGANERALAGYSGDKQATYAGLKLEGLKEAPVHVAVFSDDGTHTGAVGKRETDCFGAEQTGEGPTDDGDDREDHRRRVREQVPPIRSPAHGGSRPDSTRREA